MKFSIYLNRHVFIMVSIQKIIILLFLHQRISCFELSGITFSKMIPMHTLEIDLLQDCKSPVKRGVSGKYFSYLSINT